MAASTYGTGQILAAAVAEGVGLVAGAEAQIGWGESGLPIITVDEFWFPVKQIRLGAEHGCDPRQDRKPKGIVRPILALFN